MAQGWPFLVARGKRRGYRTILAPSFLTENRLQGVLSESTDGDHADAREVHVDRPEVGPMTLVYRTEQVSAAELNGHGSATDEHGRPLEILYGVVCRGRLRACVDAADLRAARAAALASYRRFLAEEDRFVVDASEPFALSAAPERERISPKPPPRERRGGLAAAMAAAALTAVLAVVALGASASDPHEVGAEASVTPASGEIDCSPPIILELGATITTEGRTDVVYRWRSRSWTGGRRTVTVDGRQALPPEYVGASSLAGAFELVIEEPESKRVEVKHDLRCALPPAPR
jgi:hypothetical protein